MGINKYFDKIYCINLDKRPNRWKEGKQEIDKHSLNAVRFSGVNGNPNNNIKLNGATDGDIGCTLSHYNVIKNAKENNYNIILVLEDDVIFVDNLNELFDKYIKYVPNNWDMLYFGGNHVGGLVHINKHVAKIKHTYTTHAYAIKKSVFGHVELLHGQGQKQVDVYYSEIQKIFNCYVFRPHLAWQRDGFSDIQNSHTSYPFLKN